MSLYTAMACKCRELCTDFYKHCVETMLERDWREPFEVAYSLDALSNMHVAEWRHGVRRWFQEPPGAKTTAAVSITFNKRENSGEPAERVV